MNAQDYAVILARFASDLEDATIERDYTSALAFLAAVKGTVADLETALVTEFAAGVS